MNKITWKMCEYMVIDESDEEREREICYGKMDVMA